MVSPSWFRNNSTGQWTVLRTRLRRSVKWPLPLPDPFFMPRSTGTTELTDIGKMLAAGLHFRCHAPGSRGRPYRQRFPFSGHDSRIFPPPVCTSTFTHSVTFGLVLFRFEKAGFVLVPIAPRGYSEPTATCRNKYAKLASLPWVRDSIAAGPCTGTRCGR